MTRSSPTLFEKKTVLLLISCYLGILPKVIFFSNCKSKVRVMFFLSYNKLVLLLSSFHPPFMFSLANMTCGLEVYPTILLSILIRLEIRCYTMARLVVF